ncbi:MAG: TonB-dependent receptor [Deltaproteobacteria bacterium]|nr:TonB-dependent receptor [Deltaproteobacteria bacterium]
MVNIPLIDDRLALRVSGSYIDDDGFVDDANFADEGTNNFNKGTIRAAFWYEPIEQLSINPSIMYQKTDAGSGAYDNSQSDLTWFRDLPYNEWLIDEFTLLALNIKYDLGWAELNSNTSFYDRDNTSVWDYSHFNPFLNFLLLFVSGVDPANLSPFLRQDGMAQTETFSQELRLVSTGDGPWSWIVGAFYRDRKVDFQWLIENDQLLQATGNARFFNNEGNQTSEQIAAFGDVNYTILDNLILTGGLRWFQEEIAGTYLWEMALPPFYPNLASGTTLSDLTEEDVLFKLALSYNPVFNVMLFAQFTQGIRPGGTNDRAADFGVDLDLNFYSDSTDNYEVGIKSDWLDGRLRANASFFYIDWKDVQVLDFGIIGQTFIVNASRASSTGFEIELTGQPLYGLILGLNMAYNIAETTETTVTAQGTIPDGATLPFSPELSGAVFADFTFSVREGWLGYVGADVQFMDEQFTEIQIGPDPLTPLDSYQTLNLRAGVTVNDGWDVNVFATNVTNERAELNRSVIPLKGVIRNRPRTIGLQISKSF